jgi:nicotinamidase-related amidase
MMSPIEIGTRNGGPFAIDPSTTALVMIDFQRAFIDSDSDLARRGYDMSPMQAVASSAELVLSVARRAGIKVVHTREGYAPDMSDVNALKRWRGTVGRNGALGRHLIRGEPNHEIVSNLAPFEDEAVIDKPGFDGFYRSSLEQALAGVSHLLICGLTTECCVTSTIRGAVDRGFWCLTIADACAGITPEAHSATIGLLSAKNYQFGWVCDVETVVSALRLT